MSDQTASGPIHDAIPEGDDRLRKVCNDCGYIAYENPKIVTGAVCTWEDQILLCKRAIEPKAGYWTIPSGFLELEETMEQGAIRETWEEARAKIVITSLIGIYEIPHISQIYIAYRADMISPDFAPGFESEDVKLYAFDDIPWDDLAFPTIRWSLEKFHENNGPIMATHAP